MNFCNTIAAAAFAAALTSATVTATAAAGYTVRHKARIFPVPLIRSIVFEIVLEQFLVGALGTPRSI